MYSCIIHELSTDLEYYFEINKIQVEGDEQDYKVYLDVFSPELHELKFNNDSRLSFVLGSDEIEKDDPNLYPYGDRY